MRPLIAIVGRPNVGKSTLFNRITGQRLAVVEDVPGVTRDRQYAEVIWEGNPFALIDTGGFVPSDADPLLSSVRQQAQLAVEESSAVIFLVDGRAGLTAADREVAAILRRSQKPLFLAVNKADTPKIADALLAEFYPLGFSETVAISAEHNLGVSDLLDAIVDTLPDPEAEPVIEEGSAERIRLAIIGRPNVGKSTLLNALLKQKRVVASDIPGTTRDAIDVELDFKDRHFVLTDTAGIRRKHSILLKVEQFAVFSALRALDRSDVAVLVIDATEPGVDQDAQLAALVEEKGRALVVVVNKWDLAKKAGKTEDEFRIFLKDRLRFMSYAPIIFTSALEGFRVEKVLEVATQVADQFYFKAPTSRLNKLLEKIVDAHPAPIAGGKPLRVYFMRQVRTAPPTFTLIFNRPTQVPESYRRYLVNQLRDAFDLRVPIHLVLKERPGEAARAARKRSKALPTQKRSKPKPPKKKSSK
jgi:GTP-binding protein